MSNSTVRAFGATSAASPLSALGIKRREPGATDVDVDVLFCGVCHSDLHTVRDEWNSVMPTNYPCVPGHEIVGRVARVGGRVAKFRKGDVVAVGCLVDSCRKCAACRAGTEQFCAGPATFTYNGPDAHLGGHTFGGYSARVVVDEAFVLRVPSGMDLAATAPLLCAGITTYSPMRRARVGPGRKVGVVGLGGLGHMAVKFGRAFGAHVVLFTTSPKKIEDGLRLGAHEVVVSTDAAAMAKHAGSFDFILDAVSAKHDLNAYLVLLALDGTLAMVGAPSEPLPVSVFNLIMPRRNLTGSLIGGLAETQEMLDFCAAHEVASEIEKIPAQKINEAYERLLKQDVRYRFVIDMASLS
jgi:uncharacterized zinc-type alcohol dehydrogenase-like protein